MPGIGHGFIPEVLKRAIFQGVIAAIEEKAFGWTRRRGREEGILAFASSGAALHASFAFRSRKESTGKMIAVILPPTVERCVTTALFKPPAKGS